LERSVVAFVTNSINTDSVFGRMADHQPRRRSFHAKVGNICGGGCANFDNLRGHSDERIEPISQTTAARFLQPDCLTRVKLRSRSLVTFVGFGKEDRARTFLRE
jgi:hypothetical protein